MISLKSELLRKQKEFAKEKSRNQTGSYGKPSKSTTSKALPWVKKNKGVEERNNRDMSEVLEKDKNDQVQAILEAKSKLYNKMTSGDITVDAEDTEVFLVDFEQKSIDAWREKKEKDSHAAAPKVKAKVTSDIKQALDEARDQWVEYVDSLGRTRTCLKDELPDLQRLDKKLEATPAETKTLMSDDMRREEERMKWEKAAMQEQDELHYENLRFGEIRELGVGYYAFSDQQDAREDQMKRLNHLRQETESQKRTHEDKKQKQQAMLAARLEKVRQRRIKKMKEQGKEIPASLLEPVKAELPKPQEEPKVPDITTEEDKLEKTESAPSNKVREWDKEKVEWKPARAPEPPRSWIDPREERPSEFAPPSSYFPPNVKQVRSSAHDEHSPLHSDSSEQKTPNPVSNFPTKRQYTSEDSLQTVKRAKECDSGSTNPSQEISSSLTDEERIQRLLQTISPPVPTTEPAPSAPLPYVSKDKPISLKIVPKPVKKLTTKSAFDS